MAARQPERIMDDHFPEPGERERTGDAFDPLKVTLPYFDGPLDLLLHLVRKQQLNIHEVRLVDLTEPYLAYLEKIQELNLDQAGEFLTIAATLVWLKSRALLPVDATQDDDPDPATVEEMLLLRLREYERFQELARQLGARDVLGRDVFNHPVREEGEAVLERQPFEEVSLFGLLEAFRQVLERAEKSPTLNLMPEPFRIEDRLDEMVALLGSKRQLYFHEFFLLDARRPEIILTFLALLELVRLRALQVVQAGACGTILCKVTESFLADPTAMKAAILASLAGTTQESADPAPEPPAVAN